MWWLPSRSWRHLMPKKTCRVTSKYVDTEGHLHLVGEATNHTPQGLTLRLQATLYEDATDRVVDAANLDTLLPIGPAETRPVDFADWGAVNAQSGLAADLVQRDAPIALRFEPLQSWTSAARPVRLALVETKPTFTEEDATFAVTVRNDAGNRVAEVLVTGVLRDRKDGRLLATGSAHLRPAQGWRLQIRWRAWSRCRCGRVLTQRPSALRLLLWRSHISLPRGEAETRLTRRGKPRLQLAHRCR